MWNTLTVVRICFKIYDRSKFNTYAHIGIRLIIQFNLETITSNASSAIAVWQILCSNTHTIFHPSSFGYLISATLTAISICSINLSQLQYPLRLSPYSRVCLALWVIVRSFALAFLYCEEHIHKQNLMTLYFNTCIILCIMWPVGLVSYVLCDRLVYCACVANAW